MNKSDRQVIEEFLANTDQNQPIYPVLQRVLQESPNFLKISKSTNPTTGRTLECVDKRPAVIVLVTNPDKTKGIFVKQYRVGSKSCIWECPAGVIEIDQSPLDAVYAELRQEIGLEKDSILSIQSLGATYSSVGWTNEIKYLYIATVSEYVLLKEQQLDEGENLIYAWKTFDEIKNDFLNGIMPASTLYLIDTVINQK